MIDQIIALFNHPLLQNLFVRFTAIFVVFFLGAFLVSYVVERFILKLTAKTKTDVDHKIVKKIHKPIIFIMILIGVHIGLLSIGISENWVENLSHIMRSLYIFITIYIIISVIDVLINSVGRKWAAKTESKMDDILIPLFQKAATIAIVIIGLLMVMSEWAIDITGVLAGVGIAGIAIGFAIKDSLGNIFGGIALIMDKAFTIGDTIELDDGASGKVVEVSLRSTRIRTWDNEIMIVPNGKIANSKIVNKKQPDLRIRTKIEFGVEYGADVEKVRQVVLNAINNIEGTLGEGSKAPKVRLLKMGESALEFKAYIWVADISDKVRVKEQATERIYNALNKEGIVIPYQTFTIHKN